LPQGSQYRFQNLAYSYDNVGNLTQLTNSVAFPGTQSGTGNEVGGPSTQTFAYDDLYRLTSASGGYQHKSDKTDRYRLTMAYDSLHNITTKDQVHEIVDAGGGINGQC